MGGGRKKTQNIPAQFNKKAVASSQACACCHLVSYCNMACQAQHWKQKPAGHKQFCFPPEKRRPGATQPDQ